ncbi:BREX system serine/threonine kinase PglW [Sphaerotilus mobilis]|uniref:Serine/threonine protein kinase n=1 Tax=Sphaerotilus mobilis TaxID=47994 RepID=A0A4Q7LUM9_9BURK|nr:BREX system serine/threonine kinase PglW [Sphaerotilus mobilis]RZS57942.1 serine/threonine protein kinase [Sphaerotilus mobilis]
MSLSANRWHVIAPSSYPWEQEALEWLRAQLPDREPWHVWTNFEFIDDEGKVNEVDALALTPAGLFLVEIKSRPGSVSGDAHTWTWSTDGRERSVDNPLLLTDRKSKRLASLLRRQPAIVKAKMRLPFVTPLVFLSSTSLACRLQGQARSGVYLRGRPQQDHDDGIVAALTFGSRGEISAAPLDSAAVKALAKGLAEAGVRPSNKHRQVGDYRLDKLIVDGDSYQEWQARHVGVDVQRRVRIYNLANAASPEARLSLVRQAQREFKMLEGIEHSGILRCREYKDSELGPALVFDLDDRAVRLDHLMRDHGARLGLSQRLQLVREIAEVLKYAHSRRLHHRALGPQSVLVRDIETAAPRVQLMNWQTAAREADGAGTGSSTTLHRHTGTAHVQSYVEDPGLVYLAPETARDDPAHGAELDVFSLGCLTWLIFTGQPPATSILDLHDKLRRGQGLQLSAALDGCPTRLQELVQFATNPAVVTRYGTIQEFLDELDKVEEELTRPDPEATVDPSLANLGDRLEGGYTVVRRLGRGSSSDALLVRPEGSDDELVLKIAVDGSHNENLLAEAEALGKLRHPNIVELRGITQVAGRTALLLKSAGDETLAQRIKADGRLTLEMLQRWGEELLDAVRLLEENAVVHRDIKPDNIGISKNRTGRLTLVLFDFSLTRTPPENLKAGTPPYLDPFLGLRPQRRWDLQAERFAAAVTLYEMAVGRVPRWGDGQTAAELSEAEATLEIDRLDPAVREPLRAFFTKALARHARERHDNAEDLLRAWRTVFERASTAHPVAAPQGFEALALTVTPTTTLAELGYSLEAIDVLDRMGIHNAVELLAVDRVRFRYLRGVGNKLRQEIRLKAKELARLRPDLMKGRGSLHEGDESEPEDLQLPRAVNELADALLPSRPAGDDRPEEAALAIYLGLEGEQAPGRWPTPGEAALAARVDRAVLIEEIARARQRWLKNKFFTALRKDLHELLQSQGQVMTLHEAALALLALRGCAAQDDDSRLRMACAALRAAVEADAQTEQPRYEAHPSEAGPLIAASVAWADYARQLGLAADTCAMADPLLPPERALQALEAVRAPGQITAEGADADELFGTPRAAVNAGPGHTSAAAAPLNATRLLRLATNASRNAALSARQEIYPRGMPALQSLRQSINALVGVKLTESQLQDRVRGRYPEAEPLPGRPLLDRLIEAVGAPLIWDEAARHYDALRVDDHASAGTSTYLGRHATRLPGRTRASATSADDEARLARLADASALEQRLQHHLQQGGLLSLTVEPRLARHAEAELLRRFGPASTGQPGLQRLSLDALLLRELRTQAYARRVDWATVLRADAAPAGSRDWTNLLRLVQLTLPALQQALLNSPAPLLVVHAGLLARYGLMRLVTELEDQSGRPGRTPAAWLLLPGQRPGVAEIDGTPVPLVHAQAVAALQPAWIGNEHRSAHLLGHTHLQGHTHLHHNNTMGERP